MQLHLPSEDSIRMMLTSHLVAIRWDCLVTCNGKSFHPCVFMDKWYGTWSPEEKTENSLCIRVRKINRCTNTCARPLQKPCVFSSEGSVRQQISLNKSRATNILSHADMMEGMYNIQDTVSTHKIFSNDSYLFSWLGRLNPASCLLVEIHVPKLMYQGLGSLLFVSALQKGSVHIA